LSGNSSSVLLDFVLPFRQEKGESDFNISKISPNANNFPSYKNWLISQLTVTLSIAFK
jgi:hypothetical protein